MTRAAPKRRKRAKPAKDVPDAMFEGGSEAPTTSKPRRDGKRSKASSTGMRASFAAMGSPPPAS
jgi:hypothetical protein